MLLTIDDVEIENVLIDINLFNTIGCWKDNYGNVLYHLVKEDEGYALIKEFDDGSFQMIGVTYEDCEDFCIFSVIDSPNHDFFVLTGNVLELCDKVGKIDVFEPIASIL